MRAEYKHAGLNATILRPWYVVGPGHRWPVALIPFYKLFESMNATRDGATRLGLLTLEEVVNALAWAVENPPAGVRITTVPEMKRIPTLSRTSPCRAKPVRSATHG